MLSFPDFELGKAYTLLVEVTNVSLTFNSYKTLPLEDEVANYFNVDFTPPGAGDPTRGVKGHFRSHECRYIE